jgi:glycosyltransferase involved in cell wall biosynthesis
VIEEGPPNPCTTRVSVILTDFAEHHFTSQSIQSVLTQTINPTLVELILISEDQESLSARESTLGRVKHKTIKTDLTPLGKSYRVGILEASGDIIAFLDNDDVWSPNRLERLLSVFDAEPKTTFFKNSITPIFSTSEGLLRKQIAFSLGLGISLFSHIKDVVVRDRKDIRRVSQLAPMHNMSSMAFRKRAVLPYLSEISQVPGFIDPFLFFILLITPGDLHFTSERLTGYRVRPDSASARQSRSAAAGGSNQAALHFLDAYRWNLAWMDSHLSRCNDNTVQDVRCIIGKSTECFIHLRGGEISASTVVKNLPASLGLSVRYRNFGLTIALMVVALETILGEKSREILGSLLNRVTT